MTKQSASIYEFGHFRVDPVERLLLHDDSPVILQSKAFDLLLLLVRNSGHALQKPELMNALWPNTCVEEANLAQHISLLRKALGESPGQRQYIETIQRRGYRFLPEVQVIVDPGASTDAETTPSSPDVAEPLTTPESSGFNWIPLILSACVLGVGTAAVIWMSWQKFLRPAAIRPSGPKGEFCTVIS